LGDHRPPDGHSRPIKPSCVIWNGDASTTEETTEDLVKIYLNPEIERKDYASGTPYLFCPGNHDFRGMANRHLERVWMYRQPEERATRDWDLGRNFAVRLGDIALIGLDTAEDKLDTNPHFAGLFTSEPYRRAQTEWLKDALRRDEIAHAPYLVAFCHIPIFDDDPTHNPGDCAPDDKDPRYFSDFAYWQRTCGKMWGPLLDEAGCQVLIAGHMHKYRVDARVPADAGRRSSAAVPACGRKTPPPS
jgi:Calcineurin-like phosphoesterase.